MVSWLTNCVGAPLCIIHSNCATVKANHLRAVESVLPFLPHAMEAFYRTEESDESSAEIKDFCSQVQDLFKQIVGSKA